MGQGLSKGSPETGCGLFQSHNDCRNIHRTKIVKIFCVSVRNNRTDCNYEKTTERLTEAESVASADGTLAECLTSEHAAESASASCSAVSPQSPTRFVYVIVSAMATDNFD